MLAGFVLAPQQANALSVSQLSSLDAGILQQLNFIRSQHGLTPLHLNAELTQAAIEHSDEMAQDGYFEHSSADGTAFWRRIARFYPSSDAAYWSVGENLLWSSPGVAPSAAMQLWMNSPEHRANILAARWREVGVAAVHIVHARGTFGNRAVTIITTDFGVRR